MIKRGKKNWFLISLIPLSLGGLTAISENHLSKYIDSKLPDSRGIASFKRPGTINILSFDGKVIQKIGPATREKINSGEMPLLIEQAFIASEDRRFYDHKGVDIWGIIRALISNMKQGAITEGGSTITQQLARMVFLSQDRTITRKLKEAALAYKLERQLSKKEIVEQYLNNVYLGSGAYGVADAAWVYFSKKPENLNLPEAALIAGLPPAPSLFSPLINPKAALQRRSIVLNRMERAKFISNKTVLKSINSPLNLNPSLPKYYNSKAPFFSDWLAKELPLFLTKEQLEVGGLEVRTGLNLSWQKHAKRIISRYSPNGAEGAILAIDPKSGLVKVMVGGKNFEETQFNRATQALRSPGSTFKLFPYIAAINIGLTTEDKYIDSPKCWDGYCPKNFGDKYMGEVSIVNSFKNSLNNVAVQILDEVGFEEVIKIANSLGIGNERTLGHYYPLAIGAYEQTVIDMTAAYAAITNRGVYTKPVAFEEIRGPGSRLLWSRAKDGEEGKQVIKKDVADTMNWMLQEVVNSGTGIAAKLKDRQVAGKTGTSEGSRDLWFIGSIPQLTTTIWFGYDNNESTNSSSGEAAFAWKEFMLEVIKDIAPEKFINLEVKNKDVK